MDLRDKIAEKLMRACAHLDDDPECAEMTADAVMRDVVTPQLERLRAELDKWHDAAVLAEAHIQQAGSQMAKLMREAHEAVQRAEQAETERAALKRELTGHTAAFERAWEVHREVCSEAENERLRAERDALKAATERVRAVCAGGSAGYTQRTVRVVDVHRALATPTPTEETDHA